MEGKIFSWDFLMTTVLFPFFVGLWENHFGLAIFFLSIYPSSYSILILYGFFIKKNFWFWILKKKIWLDRRKKLFQHFANLIKIRSTHLLRIFYTSDPKKKIKNREQVCRSNYTPAPRRGRGYTVLPLSVRPSKIFFGTFFSATIDGRNLIFGHKLHIGMPYRGKRFWNHQIPTSCLPT